MEIVIKIDEKDYQSLKDGHIPFNVLDVIMNGTPLHKGHGDLIDKSDLLTTTDIRADGSEFTYVPYHEINNATIVVEADKAESEEEHYDKD